jgi:hypothetical protein
MTEPDKEAKLPDDFDIETYVAAFRLLDPPTISNVMPHTMTDEVVYWAKYAFREYINRLFDVDLTRFRDGDVDNIIVNNYAKSSLVKMNVLPIVLYTGIKITFASYDPIRR